MTFLSFKSKCMGFKDIKYDLPVAHGMSSHSTGPQIQDNLLTGSSGRYFYHHHVGTTWETVKCSIFGARTAAAFSSLPSTTFCGNPLSAAPPFPPLSIPWLIIAIITMIIMLLILFSALECKIATVAINCPYQCSPHYWIPTVLGEGYKKPHWWTNNCILYWFSPVTGRQ